MRRAWIVLVREYLENVRTKAFLLAVLMTPVFAGLSFLLPAWAARQEVPTRTIAIADLTGALEPGVRTALEERKVPVEDGEKALYRIESVPLAGDPEERARDFALVRDALDARVKDRDGDLFGYVILRPSALDKGPGAASEIHSGNVADMSVAEHVRGALQRAANDHVVRTRGIPAETARILGTPPRLESRSVLLEGRQGAAWATMAPIVMMFVLFLTIVGTSQALITSTLEEKGNRVVEVLLSSVSPFQLMAGKVLGVCAVGLTLMAIWGAAGTAALAAQGLLGVIAGPHLALALVYYVLGFLLIASLMVAVGSACNTLKEAQNLLSPLMILLTLPMLLFVVVLRDPNGPVATGLSFFPLFTPFLMMMRIGQVPPPPPLQVVASIALLAVSTAVAIWLASRVFRVGILLYGKPPSVREIFRWMRSGA